MISIKVPCEGCTEQVLLSSEKLANSAFENDIDIYSLRETIIAFISNSESSTEECNQWSEEVVSMFMQHMIDAGKVRLNPAKFEAGSDTEDESETTLGINNK